MSDNQLSNSIISYEEAFNQLEAILEKLNSGTTSLDESLKLYEEADKLISICTKKLNEAERKIEMLVKNRNGEVVLGPDDKPVTQDYKPTTKDYKPTT